MPASPYEAATPPRRGQLTRERVLEAATALFAARGFAPVTMRAIGDAAGIDNSSLYRHFASKSELARAVLDRAMAGFAARLRSVASTAPATLEGVVDVVAALALHLWDHPETARLILQWVTAARDAATGFDVSLPVDAAGAPSGELYSAVIALLGRARSAGLIRDVPHPEGFVAVVGAITLRPATYRSFLASQEPARSEADARAAWESEVRLLLRALLRP
jgi:AcrR family transcriptional regulator